MYVWGINSTVTKITLFERTRQSAWLDAVILCTKTPLLEAIEQRQYSPNNIKNALSDTPCHSFKVQRLAEKKNAFLKLHFARF